MATTLERDSRELRAALTRRGETIEVALSRDTVELILEFVDASAAGKRLLIVDGDEVTPAQAAPLLGMSRPQVRKLIDRGLLESRKVGTHHRVKLDSIRRFKEAERKRSLDAMAEFAELQNDMGLTE